MCRDTYPFTGEVYLFRGKSGNKIKVLWATPDGMNFLYKRLNDAKECFTKHSFANVELS